MRQQDPSGEGHLPAYQLLWTGGDALFFTEQAAREAMARQNLQLAGAGEAAAGAGTATLRVLHENKELERLFQQLAANCISIDDYALVQTESVTGERLPTKYAWRVVNEKDGSVEFAEAPNVPSIVRVLHEVGRRGIEVKRFKGLGEMEAVQLWETTMDPARRVMLRITWDAASEADALFSTLMGENVEQRRAYIEKHALEVKNLDV
jgi:DNA gyrase subunit B